MCRAEFILIKLSNIKTKTNLYQVCVEIIKIPWAQRTTQFESVLRNIHNYSTNINNYFKTSCIFHLLVYLSEYPELTVFPNLYSSVLCLNLIHFLKLRVDSGVDSLSHPNRIVLAFTWTLTETSLLRRPQIEMSCFTPEPALLRSRLPKQTYRGWKRIRIRFKQPRVRILKCFRSFRR